MKFVIINKSSDVLTYAKNVIIQPYSSLEVESKYYYTLCNDLEFIRDIRNCNLIISDGILEYSGKEAEAVINSLAEAATRDVNGATTQRIKAAISGWKAQFHVIRITTATTNGVVNKNKNGQDLGFCTYTMYNAEDEITDDPTACVKTVVLWEPKHDMEIVGGKLFQKLSPSEDVWLYVTVAAHIPAQYGGSIEFLTGGMNLFDVADGGEVNFDGRASKFITYDAINHSGRFEILVKHPASYQHSFSIVLELFRP
jgi:hypothetical protein